MAASQNSIPRENSQATCCAECNYYDEHAAEAAFADACAFAYDQGRVFTAAETKQQATAERDRVDDVLARWAKGKRPARPFSVRKARALAEQYEDGKALLGRR